MQATKQTMKRIWWLYTILSLFLVTVGLIGILFREDDADLSFGIFLVIFGVSFFPVCFVLTKLLQKRLDKSTPFLSENTEETFVFDSDIVNNIENAFDVNEVFTGYPASGGNSFEEFFDFGCF